MARRNRTPEENARREKIRELLQMVNIGSMNDMQNLLNETIGELWRMVWKMKFENVIFYMSVKKSSVIQV